MCQMSLLNTGEAELNKLMFLLLGTLGSSVHKDGWGIAQKGKMYKCDLPMFYDEDSGQAIRKYMPNSAAPFMGHIRQASPSVPVNEENAHPFVASEVIFQHNGKLTPLDEKDFVLDYVVDTTNKTTGATERKVFKHSDSKLFLDEVMKHYADQEHIVDAINSAMEKFYGKFAFMLSINGKFYVIRGKTADLYISYRMDGPKEDAKILGYVIHTSALLLDTCAILASNIQELEGKPRLHFSLPTLLKEETAFLAEKTGLKEIGTVKENAAPVVVYTPKSSQQTNFTGASTKTTSAISLTARDKLFQRVYDFTRSYSISIRDLQYIFMELYGTSLQEVTEPILQHFVDKAIPNMEKSVEGKTRKRVRRALAGMPVGLLHYYKAEEMQFPWFLSPKSAVWALLDKLEKREKA